MPELQKSIILFVVEGRSDSIALKIPLRNLLRDSGFSDRFEIDIYGTDPLVHNRQDKNNPKIKDPLEVTKRVRDGVLDYLKSSKNKKIIKASDIAAVVLISDLDACFCHPDSIVQSPGSFREIIYDAENRLISCQNVDYIQRRNEAKKDAVGIIVHEGWLPLIANKKAIPLGIFYFNINREHALSNINKPGMEEEEKMDIAIGFRQEYSGKVEDFRLLLADKLPDGVRSYLDSWKEPLLQKYAFLPACNLLLVIQWLKDNLPTGSC